jgi:hypothetical protein
MHLASKEISDQAMAYREAGYTVAYWSLNLRVKRASITSRNKPSEFLIWQRSPVFMQQRPIRKEHSALP